MMGVVDRLVDDGVGSGRGETDTESLRPMVTSKVNLLLKMIAACRFP